MCQVSMFQNFTNFPSPHLEMVRLDVGEFIYHNMNFFWFRCATLRLFQISLGILCLFCSQTNKFSSTEQNSNLSHLGKIYTIIVAVVVVCRICVLRWDFPVFRSRVVLVFKSFIGLVLSKNLSRVDRRYFSADSELTHNCWTIKTWEFSISSSGKSPF